MDSVNSPAADPDSTQDGLDLSRERALEIAARIARLSTSSSHGVSLIHTVQSVTRIANGRVLLNNDGETPDFNLSVRVGNRWGNCKISQLDDATLRYALGHAERMARLSPGFRTHGYRMSDVRLPIPEVDLWKLPTVSAMNGQGAVRSEALPSMLETVGRSPFLAAGILSFTARSYFMTRSNGPEAFYRETDVSCSVSARAKDGSSSGWAGTMSRDWSTINVRDVAERAVAVAQKAVNPVALEPGRRTVVLSATASGQLFAMLAGMFDAKATDAGMTPFSSPRGHSKLGQRVVDERIRLWSDPNDPMGGYMPFWGDIVDGTDILVGKPLPAMTWIDQGVLTNLAYTHSYSLEQGKAGNRPPVSYHMDVVPGVEYTSVDQMIADCKEGIFVNRFSQMMPVDRTSGQVTGVTRDGCFFIKDGKIKTPIKNFRFLDSPVFVLNKLIAIGKPERVIVDDSVGNGAIFPVIAPPIMAHDFNFSAMSDAV